MSGSHGPQYLQYNQEIRPLKISAEETESKLTSDKNNTESPLSCERQALSGAWLVDVWLVDHNQMVHWFVELLS